MPPLYRARAPGFAALLCTKCLDFASVSLRKSSPHHTQNGQTSLVGEELGKLYLWAQGFDRGDLEVILRESKELEDTVLESLGGVGEVLVRAFPPSPSSDTHLLKSAQDLRTLVQRSKELTRASYLSAIDDEEDDAYASNDECVLSVSSVEPETLKDFLDQLSADINRLLALVPSMERTLRAARSDRDSFEDGGFRRKKARFDAGLGLDGKMQSVDGRRDFQGVELSFSGDQDGRAHDEEQQEFDDDGVEKLDDGDRLARIGPDGRHSQPRRDHQQRDYHLPKLSSSESTPSSPPLSDISSYGLSYGPQNGVVASKRKRGVQHGDITLPQAGSEAPREEMGGHYGARRESSAIPTEYVPLLGSQKGAMPGEQWNLPFRGGGKPPVTEGRR